MIDEIHTGTSRREALRRVGLGFGNLALLSMLSGSTQGKTQVKSNGAAATNLKQPRLAPQAKRVIFLFMHGGVSQIDSFDPKPMLDKMDGLPLPDSFRQEGKPIGQNIHVQQDLYVLKSPWQFRMYGQSGIQVSQLFPNVARQIDDICVLRSLSHTRVDHGQAVPVLHTGSGIFIRPSMGSWILYGLGSENQNLPGFISICPGSFHGGTLNHNSAFLPPRYQGTALGATSGRGRTDDAQRARFQNLVRAEGTTRLQRLQLDLIQAENRRHLRRSPNDAELEARIESFEMAFRMQAEAPQVMDISDETQQTLAAYGVGRTVTNNFGHQCLLARRFAERGVRFVQCTHSYKWDQHGALKRKHEQNALEVDQPIAALLRDLKQRGLLEETLVLWGTEFGRTPVAEGKDGRDHNPYGFTVWMAGGGVRGGMTYGATDDLGFYAVENKLEVCDIHATILHLLGLDHTKLTYRHSGRDFRLTDVGGRVLHDIMGRA